MSGSRLRGHATHKSIRLHVADAWALPYADENFDLGLAISAFEHAVKYEGTAREFCRVLRRGGLAVFTENLGENRLLNAARRFTMLGEQDAGDVLLTTALIRAWADDGGFSSGRIEGYSLLFMAKRLIATHHRVLRALHLADCAPFAAAPRLRRYGGECVIALRR